MNILTTVCILCKREIPVVGHDPLSDSSHFKPDSQIGVVCVHHEGGARYSTSFSKCYFRPNKLGAD